MCGEWNTMEEKTAPAQGTYAPAASGSEHTPVRLSEIHNAAQGRLCLQMPEVDGPLGGGLVEGSVILIGGEPGIGKSTLVFQICRAVCEAEEKVLYCSSVSTVIAALSWLGPI